eukprot:768391-Hanusia_phi.AAC.9
MMYIKRTTTIKRTTRATLLRDCSGANFSSSTGTKGLVVSSLNASSSSSSETHFPAKSRHLRKLKSNVRLTGSSAIMASSLLF